MRGEGQCAKCPDESEEHPYHCIHPRMREKDWFCCWCGLLFLGMEEFGHGLHGEYLTASLEMK